MAAIHKSNGQQFLLQGSYIPRRAPVHFHGTAHLDWGQNKIPYHGSSNRGAQAQSVKYSNLGFYHPVSVASEAWFMDRVISKSGFFLPVSRRQSMLISVSTMSDIHLRIFRPSRV
jgi:hypothetical protein